MLILETETNQINLNHRQDYQGHIVKKLLVAIPKLTNSNYRSSKKITHKPLLFKNNLLITKIIIKNQTIIINILTITAHQAQVQANQTYLIEIAKHQ